eukprot:TRINITY_DN94678_c0_g1_i1.p1 TRINITY_DN94678_c0_g1~~TRINITY_DN94678_c0_g1_i1.p1  ORF type:complete len:175 (-),score=29.68 TRINITY_DN94678_c0_g1_i1:21-500(-)
MAVYEEQIKHRVFDWLSKVEVDQNNQEPPVAPLPRQFLSSEYEYHQREGRQEASLALLHQLQRRRRPRVVVVNNPSSSSVMLGQQTSASCRYTARRVQPLAYHSQVRATTTQRYNQQQHTNHHYQCPPQQQTRHLHQQTTRPLSMRSVAHLQTTVHHFR